MSKSLYLKLNQISEVHEKDVYLKDVAELYSDDPAILAKCLALKVKKISSDRDHRYVGSVLDVIGLISKLDPSIQVENMGEQDFIVEYSTKPKEHPAMTAFKVAIVCLICFFGSAFSIMAFNNDVSTVDMFGQFYTLMTGQESDGFTILELTYSLGLSAGIIAFFNHIGGRRLSKEPTPIEVEMRLYEDDVNTTLINAASRNGAHKNEQ